MLQLCSRLTDGVRQLFHGKGDDRASLSLWTDQLLAGIAPLSQRIETQRKYETEYLKCLDVFKDAPPAPAIFSTMEKLLQAMGLDRLRDQFLEGGLKAVQEMVPSVATYGGAALSCLRELKTQVESDVQLASIDKAILVINRQERRRQQGKAQISLKSKRAIEKAKADIAQWLALSQQILKEIPAALAVPTQIVHAAHATLS